MKHRFTVIWFEKVRLYGQEAVQECRKGFDFLSDATEFVNRISKRKDVSGVTVK